MKVRYKRGKKGGVESKNIFNDWTIIYNNFVFSVE